MTHNALYHPRIRENINSIYLSDECPQNETFFFSGMMTLGRLEQLGKKSSKYLSKACKTVQTLVSSKARDFQSSYNWQGHNVSRMPGIHVAVPLNTPD